MLFSLYILSILRLLYLSGSKHEGAFICKNRLAIIKLLLLFAILTFDKRGLVFLRGRLSHQFYSLLGCIKLLLFLGQSVLLDETKLWGSHRRTILTFTYGTIAHWEVRPTKFRHFLPLSLYLSESIFKFSFVYLNVFVLDLDVHF